MISLLKTDSSHPDFAPLVRLLDADLAIRDGEEHAFYAQFNKTDHLKNVVLAYEGDRAVACGAFRPFEPSVVEIKRMYTLPDCRGKGIASLVLAELEQWAGSLSFEKCVLETGKKQPEAIRLYTKNGYSVIPNYGQYAGIDNSVCFEKVLPGREL